MSEIAVTFTAEKYPILLAVSEDQARQLLALLDLPVDLNGSCPGQQMMGRAHLAAERAHDNADHADLVLPIAHLMIMGAYARETLITWAQTDQPVSRQPGSGRGRLSRADQALNDEIEPLIHQLADNIAKGEDWKGLFGPPGT